MSAKLYKTLGCVYMGSALVLYVAGVYSNTTDTELLPSFDTGGVETVVLPEPEPTESQVEDWSGWNLVIPEINLKHKMTQVFRQDNTIGVPDVIPGYFLEYPGNTFIVGHNTTVFQRLNEIPTSITIVIDGLATDYYLDTYELTRVTEVNMNKVLHYQGISIMTCAGEKYGSTMSHRLVLYYK